MTEEPIEAAAICHVAWLMHSAAWTAYEMMLPVRPAVNLALSSCQITGVC